MKFTGEEVDRKKYYWAAVVFTSLILVCFLYRTVYTPKTEETSQNIAITDSIVDSEGTGDSEEESLKDFRDEESEEVDSSAIETESLPPPPPIIKEESESQETETETSGSQAIESSVIEPLQFDYTTFPQEVSLVGEAVEAYISAGFDQPISQVAAPYRNKGRLDAGEAVTIAYTLRGLPEGISVASACVEVAEHTSYSGGRRVVLQTETEAKFYNLKTGREYHYRITVTLSNGTVLVGEETFITQPTPRILNIAGIYNVRDIGGWSTADGSRIRQGLLYRGTELDGAVVAAYCLTESGKEDMLSVLGIRMDMDLRAASVNSSQYGALGPSVKHTYYDAAVYNGIFTPNGRETMRKVFSDLAKPENYPVYLHCTYGCDRTGTVCILLEALLGVSREDVIREYELSGLLAAALDRDYYGTFMTELESLEGAALQEKAENYLLSAGVTREEIERIRSIFLS